jgi:hypothetical protein
MIYLVPSDILQSPVIPKDCRLVDKLGTVNLEPYRSLHQSRILTIEQRRISGASRHDFGQITPINFGPSGSAGFGAIFNLSLSRGMDREWVRWVAADSRFAGTEQMGTLAIQSSWKTRDL